MRIISGKYRSLKIQPPKYFKHRPTTDQAKEALFNILNNYFDYSELNVLDLFAGTGSITYEFLSRGCNFVTAVEINKKYVNFIDKTIEQLNETNRATVLNLDAFQFVEKNNLSTFQFIFADPPYDDVRIAELPDLIYKNNTHKLWLVLEHSSKYDFSKHPNFSEQRRYGKVNFSFFEKLEKK